MIPEESKNIFHKYLNFFIFILVIIALAMMIKLLYTEHFVNNNKSNKNNLNIDSLTQITKCQTCNQDNKPLQFITPEKTHNTHSEIENTNIVEVSSCDLFYNNNGEVTEKIANNIVNASNNSNANDNVQNNLSDYQLDSMLRKVKNFILFPDEQKYCPNLDNSENSFWSQLPEDYAGDHYAKFCCTSCYQLVAKEIFCGENKNGLYKIDYFNSNDFAHLKDLFEGELKQKKMIEEDLFFPEIKLNSLFGKPVLKFKYGNKYYVIQIIKSHKELLEHEETPAIVTELYQKTYSCPTNVTKPVIQFV